MLKSEIRKEFLSIRRKINSKDREILNSKIFDYIKQSDVYNQSNTILIYVSTDDEVDTRKLIEYSLKIGKQVYVPVTDYKTHTMQFYSIRSIKELTICKHGIYEPVPTPEKLYNSAKNSLCIVPAIVFSRIGYRVGYGGGYYDRFLSKFNGISVGICYNQMICDSFVAESHDIAVNMLATEHGFIRLS